MCSVSSHGEDELTSHGDSEIPSDLVCWNEAGEYLRRKARLEVEEEDVVAVSIHVCSLLSVAMRNIVVDCGKSPFETPLEEIRLTKEGVELERKVEQFFIYMKRHAHTTFGELVHIDILLALLLWHEREGMMKGERRIVCMENIGTLLMCAGIVAVKMGRDVPFRTGWWARAFGMHVSVLSQSEEVFVQRIRYQCYVSCEDYLALAWTFRTFVWWKRRVERGGEVERVLGGAEASGEKRVDNGESGEKHITPKVSSVASAVSSLVRQASPKLVGENAHPTLLVGA